MVDCDVKLQHKQTKQNVDEKNLYNSIPHLCKRFLDHSRVSTNTASQLPSRLQKHSGDKMTVKYSYASCAVFTYVHVVHERPWCALNLLEHLQ